MTAHQVADNVLMAKDALQDLDEIRRLLSEDRKARRSRRTEYIDEAMWLLIKLDYALTEIAGGDAMSR